MENKHKIGKNPPKTTNMRRPYGGQTFLGINI